MSTPSTEDVMRWASLGLSNGLREDMAAPSEWLTEHDRKIREEERERCAVVVERYSKGYSLHPDDAVVDRTKARIAAEIRALSAGDDQALYDLGVRDAELGSLEPMRSEPAYLRGFRATWEARTQPEGDDRG